MTGAADKTAMLTALQEGKVTLQGQFINSSNYTYLGMLEYLEESVPVVYKPVRGERPLWDFPAGTLARREAAAYVMSDTLNWNLVPPTVFRDVPVLGPGSLQQFIVHNPEEHYFNFSDEMGLPVEKIVIFDALINNADRKASHILRDENNHFWLIDHGICFHTEDKLRTVIWDYAGKAIPTTLITDLDKVVDGREIRHSLRENLLNYLSPGEIHGIARRALRLIKTGCFPQPDENHRPFPWPPV